MTDPFRPIPPAFPRTRLERTGLDADTVDRLESEYDALDGRRRVEFGRYVTSHSDDVIRDRFTEGVAGVEQPEQPAEPAAAPTYDELNALTVDELEQRLRAWNEAHPDAHLAVTGRKGELIGRLLDAHEQQANASAPVAEVSEPVQVATAGTEQSTGGTVADEQQLPTAPTATTPEGAPEAAPVVPTDASGSPGVPAPVVEAQATAQTADAAGAGTATTEE